VTSSSPQDRPENNTTLDQGQIAANSGAANDRLQTELHSVRGLSAPIKAGAPADKHTQTQPEELNHSGFLGALVQNAAYTGIQETAKSITQIADQVTGGNAADGINLVAKPAATEYKSAEWYGEQFGGAIGKLAPFLAAFAVTRGASAKLGLNVALESAAEQTAFLNRNNMILIGQTGVAGFASEAVFTSNQGPKKGFADFATERLKNGLIGGVDMAALTAGTIGLKTLSTTVAKDSPFIGAVLRNPAAAATISGYPIGMLSADMHSGLFEGRFATMQEREQGGFGMSVVGFGLGAIHGKMTEHAVDRAKYPTITDVLKTNAERGLQHVDNFMASVNPLLIENRMQLAPAGGRVPLRNLAMQSTLVELNRPNIMMRDGDAAATSSAGDGGKPKRGGGGSDKGREGKTEGNERTVEQTHPKLTTALEELNFPEIRDFVAKDKTLKNQRVVRSLGGEGNDSPVVLELAPSKEFPHGGVLKATIPEGGWQNEWGKRPFDAQLLSKVSEVELNGSGFSGTANVYVQEIVDVAKRYDPSLVSEFDGLLQESGLELGDPGSGVNGQMGVSRRTGQLRLIDYPSVGKAGEFDNLKPFLEGAEGLEREWDAENENIKAGKNKPEDHGDDLTAVDVDREVKRQQGLETGQFTANERDVLNQISMGDSPKDIQMYYALIEGKTLPGGMPDMKQAKLMYDKLVKRAQAAGVLEKSGKKARIADDDDY